MPPLHRRMPARDVEGAPTPACVYKYTLNSSKTNGLGLRKEVVSRTARTIGPAAPSSETRRSRAQGSTPRARAPCRLLPVGWMGRCRPELAPEAAYRVRLDREVLVGLAGGDIEAEAVDVVAYQRAVLADDHHRDAVEADRQVDERIVVAVLGEPSGGRDLPALAGCDRRWGSPAFRARLASPKDCEMRLRPKSIGSSRHPAARA